MSKHGTRRVAAVGILAALGLAIGIGLAAAPASEGRPATIADTIWGVVPPQPAPTSTTAASAVVLDDTIWG
ncbi:hypothetical protein ACPC54_18080 [Kitasatospora sp. NPDC094028]